MAENEEMVSIPKNHIRLLQPKGYFERFYELIAIYPSHKAAYQAVESELFSSFRVTRYSSYESFRTMKDKYYKK